MESKFLYLATLSWKTDAIENEKSLKNKKQDEYADINVFNQDKVVENKEKHTTGAVICG